MDLVEAVAACPSLPGNAALFHSERALRSMLEEEETQGDGALRQARGTSFPGAGPEGCVTIASGCTLCGQCDWACPTGAIHLGEGGATLEIQDSLCTGCGMCASACPENVLAIQPLAPVRRYGSY